MTGTEERLEILRQAGAIVLGLHPSNAVKLALPSSAIDTVGRCMSR